MCRDGVQSTLSVYMPGIQRFAFKQLQKNQLLSHSNTLTLDGRVCVDVGHGSLLQHLGAVLPGWENSDVVVRRPVFIVAV